MQPIDGTAESTVDPLAADLVHGTPLDANTHREWIPGVDLDVGVARVVAYLKTAAHIEFHLDRRVTLPECGGGRLTDDNLHEEAAWPLITRRAETLRVQCKWAERRLRRDDNITHAARPRLGCRVRRTL